MTFLIFDYVNAKGDNEFHAWASKLEPSQKAKLKEKIDKLRLHGNTLYPDMLTGTGVPGISKLRARGNVQLRPLLCAGPVSVHTEYTMLMGAKEVGDRWVPKDAPAIAKGKKDEVIRDPTARRKPHEKFC